MIVAWRLPARPVHGALGVVVMFQPRSPPMIWETPVAIDLRLGMEITMYADHR